jgi:hypothetical protein
MVVGRLLSEQKLDPNGHVQGLERWNAILSLYPDKDEQGVVEHNHETSFVKGLGQIFLRFSANS